MHNAEFELDAGDATTCDAVARALAVELADGPEGSRATIRADSRTLHIAIEAGDASALRAAMNSVLRLADAALRSTRPRPPSR
jgi:tRNA threonylcarbamoyladenosine modification (KEOPS) complex  Pcc1 subunit